LGTETLPSLFTTVHSHVINTVQRWSGIMSIQLSPALPFGQFLSTHFDLGNVSFV
jgi:hypothetical protein